MDSEELARLMKLPKRAKMALAEKLWVSVAEEYGLEVPLEHKQILKARLTDYKNGNSRPISHTELMRRLRETSGCYR